MILHESKLPLLDIDKASFESQKLIPSIATLWNYRAEVQPMLSNERDGRIWEKATIPVDIDNAQYINWETPS